MISFMQLLWGEPIAHRAVLDNCSELLADVQRTAEPLLRMVNGWQLDPVELAQYLGKEEMLSSVLPGRERSFRVLLKGRRNFRTLNQHELSELVGFHYWPHLYFEDYSMLKKVICNCPYLFRSVAFAEENLKQGLQYRREIEQGYTVKTSIRWIDEVLGYGLFAEENLDKGRYIGEYAGKVRRLSRFFPDKNAYCFHYPTKLFSRRYHVIDSETIGNELRFANHSDQPNLEPMWIVDRGLLHLIFKAKMPIRKGSQLTFDYGSDYWKTREKTDV